ncbi:hypothetical protein B5S32_g780 [[Candida] boidinii]|nr:hypothetical protein B5S32_g780 [[Candida] boidinii]
MWVSIQFFVSILSAALLSVASALDDEGLVFQYNKASNESLLWGPYRSNLYVGVRPRIPHSLMTGLMWFNMDNYNNVQKMRHFCDQNDDMKGFGWTQYDPRIGGRQIIKDKEMHIKIITDFVKTDSGNWALKIKGIPTKKNLKTSLVFYAGLEGDGLLEYAGMRDLPTNLVSGNLKLLGYSTPLGSAFEMDIFDTKDNKYIKSSKPLVDPELDPSLTHHMSLHVPDGNVWLAKDVFMTLLQEEISEVQTQFEKITDVPVEQLFSLKNTQDFTGNLHFIQKSFEGEFEFSITFNVDGTSDQFNKENLDESITSALNKFDEKFSRNFQLKAPFNSDKFIKFGKEMLSQLMGGIGYFYGDQQVDRNAVVDDVDFTTSQLEGKSEGPYELFTAVPSRPFFPRGFYWDEGFHLLPILEHDVDLVLEIVKSWFSLIDDDGWIAREQILGDEARSKVPKEFTVQNPNIANPPTLMLVFTELLDIAKKRHLLNSQSMQIDDQIVIGDDGFTSSELGDAHLLHPELLIDYAKEVYPMLKKHYEWFRTTQRGEMDEFDRNAYSAKEAYRWKGRSVTHCLPSGLDDYPRCEPDVSELNVDLISWIGVMTKSMKQIAFLLEEHEDSQEYSSILYNITRNIDDLHWSEKYKSYCDVSVDDDDETEFVCHIGYVTLMPFIHGLIPLDSSHLLDILKTIRDPKQLWTPYGIRSLSKADSKFHTEEDYWRGHIWININYLILESLFRYGSEDAVDPEVRALAAKTYKELRVNIVNNIYNNYVKTGFVWEQYNEGTGVGQRTRHFAGWTSLVVLIMKMPETVS